MNRCKSQIISHKYCKDFPCLTDPSGSIHKGPVVVVCNKPVYAEGFCAKHYNIYLKTWKSEQ